MTNLSRSFRSRRSPLVAAVFASLLILGCRDATSAGKPAPPGVSVDFRLKTVDGRTIGPKDFKGQVVVIDFWATWCGPCHLQAEILQPIYKEYKGRGVQFLAANVGEDLDTVKKFLAKKPFPYPVLLDPDQNVSADLGVVALPTLLVVDKKGKVAWLQSGIADGDTLRQMIKKAGA
ncbi:MAG TPA: TlpA disulfide reductase family protein [Thermoanaerobaculia bacterium]